MNQIETLYKRIFELEVFKKGDFITFTPGSTHSSHTKDGCLILVFMRGINKPI